MREDRWGRREGYVTKKSRREANCFFFLGVENLSYRLKVGIGGCGREYPCSDGDEQQQQQHHHEPGKVGRKGWKVCEEEGATATLEKGEKGAEPN